MVTSHAKWDRVSAADAAHVNFSASKDCFIYASAERQDVGVAMTGSGETLRIGATFVDKWSGEYNKDADKPLLGYGQKLRAQGHYDLETFIKVGEWKSVRATTCMKHNEAKDLVEISQRAFEAPLIEQHKIIQELHGVGTAVASALLMVWSPKVHTVFDYRSIETLRTAGKLKARPKMPHYLDYLAVCTRLAADVGRDLRDLDRSLWAYSKYGS